MVAPAEEGSESQAVPELCPGREVGWIFKNGDAVAVERRDDKVVPLARIRAHGDE